MSFFVGKTSKSFDYTQMYEMDWNKLKIDLNSIFFWVRINDILCTKIGLIYLTQNALQW